MPEARRRGVLLRWHNELAGEVPLRATAMRQIALNLVLNACQATPRGRSVTAAFTRGPQAIIVQVDDEGPCLPASAVEMLLAGVGVPAPIAKGTGLGLWMTNRLVRELEGSACVEPRAEGGARVTVVVPACQDVELDDVA